MGTAELVLLLKTLSDSKLTTRTEPIKFIMKTKIEKCIDFYKERFRTCHGGWNYVVHSKRFESRGTVLT